MLVRKGLTALGLTKKLPRAFRHAAQDGAAHSKRNSKGARLDCCACRPAGLPPALSEVPRALD